MATRYKNLAQRTHTLIKGKGTISLDARWKFADFKGHLTTPFSSLLALKKYLKRKIFSVTLRYIHWKYSFFVPFLSLRGTRRVHYEFPGHTSVNF